MAAPEQGADTGHEMADQIPQQGLEDPGPPIVLTLKIDVDGNSQVRYLGDPPWAIDQLRAIADQIERETLI